MLKVLHIGKSFPIIGGVETVMFDLCVGLSDLGVQSDFLGANSDIYQAETIFYKKNFTIYTVKSFTQKASTFLSPDFIRMLRHLKDNYDILHIHHPDPMATLALYLSGFKGKVVCHWHSDILKQKIILKFYKPMQKWMLKRSDVIIGTSPDYIQHSSFLQPFLSKVKLVPIGIPPVSHEYKSDALDSIQLMAKKRKIIFGLGRLIYYKGFEHLIKAVALLPENYMAIIGGKGPLKKELKALIKKLNLKNRIFLVGRIPDKEMSAYFSSCDVFCMPSTEKTEAFGIAQVEAMAYGKPVVTTEIEGSGVPWVNENGVSGFNVPVGDEKALAEKLQLIFSDTSLYDRLSEGAKKRYENNFTQKAMAEKTLEIYKTLLPGKII